MKIRFLTEVVLLTIIVSSCYHEKITRPHLHNFPYLDDCPSLEERSIENEDFLKAQAKALNMRYVDYLHYLTNRARKEDEILGVNN